MPFPEHWDIPVTCLRDLIDTVTIIELSLSSNYSELSLVDGQTDRQTDKISTSLENQVIYCKDPFVLTCFDIFVCVCVCVCVCVRSPIKMKIWIDRYFAYNMGRDDAQQQCLVCTEFICVSGYAKGAYNSVCVCLCVLWVFKWPL